MKYLMLIVLLAGCQTFPSDTKQIQVACASATSSIQIATLYKDKLSATQVTRVKQAIAVTQPVCGDPDTVPTLDSVKRAALKQRLASSSRSPRRYRSERSQFDRADQHQRPAVPGPERDQEAGSGARPRAVA